MNRKKLKIYLALTILIGALVSTIVLEIYFLNMLSRRGGLNIDFNLVNSVRAYENGVLKYSFGDTEVMTNIGKNFTAFKLSGNTAWLDAGSMLKNVTYMSWGDQGSLSATSVILPSEIIRYDVKANFTYISLGKWNYTGYWKPTGSGNVDCVGLNWHSSGNNLYCYDVFTQIAYTTSYEFYSYWQFAITYS
jgi:hypothetical protein